MGRVGAPGSLALYSLWNYLVGWLSFNFGFSLPFWKEKQKNIFFFFSAELVHTLLVGK